MDKENCHDVFFEFNFSKLFHHIYHKLYGFLAILLDELIAEERNETACICDKCPPSRRGVNIKIALVNFVKVIRK